MVEWVTKQGTPAYDETITEEKPDAPDGDKSDRDFDEKYDEAVELVSDLGHAFKELAAAPAAPEKEAKPAKKGKK